MKILQASSESVDLLGRTFVNLRNRHFFVLDFLLFCVTPLIAVWLRTDGVDELAGWVYLMRWANTLALYALIAIALRWIVFFPFGLYSRYWRYASIGELVQITAAVAMATVLNALVFFGILRPLGMHFDEIPRTLPFLDGILVLIAVGGTRFSVRYIAQMRQRSKTAAENTQRVAVIGAGDAGAMIVKEMQANPQLGLEPVVFLDDDLHKQRAVIYGVPVVGDCSQIGKLVERYGVQQAIIAIPTAPGKKLRELTQLCRESGLPVKTVPGIFELLDGSVAVSKLRPIDIPDLLRREPVITDMAPVLQLLKGKCVLVTGAGGSIGSELCRQIVHCNPSRLVLLGHGENSIFDIYNELTRETKAPSGAASRTTRCHAAIVDIRFPNRLRTVFEKYRPDVVFHAAAHKHVSLMEDNLEDAVTNNVLGTRNLLEISAETGVEQFVLISTDKAVNPTSVMGVTKRIAERMVQATAERTGRCFVAVRFGNVLGSRGSVVNIFKQQIAVGGPITITDPAIERYFMTIPEAVQLVLQAATLGQGGEILVLDMGEPVKITDLARDIIRLCGLEEGVDIEIVFIGLRPGEKMYEELYGAGESHQPTRHQKVFVVRTHESDKVQATLGEQLDGLIAAAQGGDQMRIRRLLQEIVPEYRPAKRVLEPVFDVTPHSKRAGLTE